MSDKKAPEIPGYKIIKIIGEGGMGIVYLALQTVLDRKVALKVTLPSLAEMDESFTKRFVREAKATAALNHPNIITIFDAGEFENSSYMAMEYIAGGTLADLENSHISHENICQLFIGICQGLGAAHKAGFVHRDIKPDNILIGPHGNPQVTDFGIVKSLGSKNTAITLAGGTIGTPQYMSPEQIKAEKLDGRSDLYSVGVMMFNLLEGHVPFYDETPSAVYIKHVTTTAPPLSKKNAAFQPIIKKLLRKEPKNRFAHAEELVQELKALHKSGYAVIKSKKSIENDTIEVNPEDIQEKSRKRKNIKRKVITGAPTIVANDPLEGNPGNIQKKHIKRQNNKSKVKRKVITGDPTIVANESFQISKFDFKSFINKNFKAVITVASLIVLIGIYFVVNKLISNSEEADKQQRLIAKDKRNQEHKSYWKKAKKANSIASYQRYLNKYPQGSFKNQATENQNILKQQDQAKIVEQKKLQAEVESIANVEVDKPIIEKAKNQVDPVNKNDSLLKTVDVNKKPGNPPVEDEKPIVSKPVEIVVKTKTINQNQLNQESITNLFQQAQTDVKKWNLMSPAGNNAYEKYKKILTIDTNNVQAKKGILELVEKYISLASNSQKNQKFNQAKNYISNARVIRNEYIASGYDANELYGVSQSVSITNIQALIRQFDLQEREYNDEQKKLIAQNTTPTLEESFKKGEKAYQDKDFVNAEKWLLIAADKNDKRAQALLGNIYYSGVEGVRKNTEKAFQWAQKSAIQNYSPAQMLLGVMYERGVGASQNYTKAIDWYRKAADQGNKTAQNNLGYLYFNGVGVKRDKQKAFDWYLKAANQGSANAQGNIGLMYYNGEGIKRNYYKAYDWYLKAANQNHGDAQSILGIMHEIGRGTRKSRLKAISWYKKAAVQGNELAIQKLKQMGIKN